MLLKVKVEFNGISYLLIFVPEFRRGIQGFMHRELNKHT